MLVSFWSPGYREETAQILTLVGGMCCRMFPCSIVAAENYLHTRNLGFHLLGSRYDTVRKGAKRGSEVYYKAGEIFVRHVCREMGRSSKFGSIIRADGNGLMFMPMDQSLYEDSYSFLVREALDQQVDFLETRFDEVFLNLQPNENDTTMTMLDRSDVVVVCLPAKEESFESFFDRYRYIFGKCFFVFFGTGMRTGVIRQTVNRYAPGFSSRFCFLEMSRILRNYLSDGRGLDYLDRFGTFSEEPSLNMHLVAEENGEYARRNDVDLRIVGNPINEDVYEGGTADETERRTIRSIQYISNWLIKREYRDAGGDIRVITDRMLRRKIIPAEVIEWEMLGQKQM